MKWTDPTQAALGGYGSFFRIIQVNTIKFQQKISFLLCEIYFIDKFFSDFESSYDFISSETNKLRKILSGSRKIVFTKTLYVILKLI